MKGAWQSLEELAVRVKLNIATLSGTADFFVKNHSEFDILEEAGVAIMIVFAVSIAGAIATIKLFQTKLTFEVP